MAIDNRISIKNRFSRISVSSFIPPKFDYLIGWYKFDEGGGLIAKNSAGPGLSGGGKLPNLTIINNLSNFWSYLPGFGSNPNLNPPLNRAYCNFSTRNIGNLHCMASFMRHKQPCTMGQGLLIHLYMTSGNAQRFYLSLSSTQIDQFYYEYTSSYSYKYNIPYGSPQWFWVFNLNKQLVFRKTDGIGIYGSIGPVQQAAIANTLDIGSDGAGAGVQSSFGDVIIYNNIQLTASEWNIWYSYLRFRYGMSSPSG